MSIKQKIIDYKLLMKFTLSFTVVFTCVICYLLHPDVASFNWNNVLLLFAAGMLVTGSANAINQIIEKDTDALMKRTANRPVASGRMSVEEAGVFAAGSGILGVLMMWNYFNGWSAVLSAISLLIYAFVYTPLKKKNSIAVLVGGIPGALPCLIGWVAGIADQGSQSWIGGWVLFAIQFIWQFPHFWAIAWLAHKDYEGAGFKLLPSTNGQTKYSAQQALIYSLLMIPIGLLPYVMNLVNESNLSQTPSLYIVLLCNILMVLQSYRLLTDMNAAAARRVMFSSYIYLPVVFLALLLFK
jgi:protoheme IX farnesyltransferase